MFWHFEAFLDKTDLEIQDEESLWDFVPPLLSNVGLFASPPKPQKQNHDDFYKKNKEW